MKVALSLVAPLVAVLAVVMSGVSATTNAHVSSTPIATQALSGDSSCGGTTTFFQQSLDGQFTGCFRVPDLRASSLVVALQTYELHPSSTTHLTTTTQVAGTHVGAITLTLSARFVTPGQHVVVSGHLATPLTTAHPRPANVTVCWDGCMTGLDEVAVPVTWESLTTFNAPLTVPAAAWLSFRNSTISVHPLVSGTYQVALQCFGATSGCALGAGEATTSIELRAPLAARCVSGRVCETMTLSPSKAAVGDMVRISGWAPLQEIIGQPTTYMLSVTPATSAKTYPAFAVAQQPSAGTYDVVLAPRVLHVSPSPTWASLGHVGYLSSSFAGPTAVQPVNGTNLVAWCPTSGLAHSGGPALVHVATSGVTTALRGTALSIAPPTPSNPPCTTALLDPRHRASVYASFVAELDHNAPPLLYAGLYTTNDGAAWHLVPAPADMNVEDFGGFVTSAHGVQAMFIDPNNAGTRTPSGTRAGRVVTEVTTNGGLSWTTSSLGCPSVGPCTTFGPYQWGHCAMHAAPQDLLQGPVGSHAASGVSWTTTLWSQTVDSCHAPQLAVTSSHSLLLVDPSANDPVLRSSDGGTSWTPVAIPLVKTGGFATSLIQWGYPLMFAPDGSLLTVVTDATRPYQGLFRLAPGASTWCQVPHVLGSLTTKGVAGPFAFRGGDLVWVQTTRPDTPKASSVLDVTALAKLHC